MKAREIFFIGIGYSLTLEDNILEVRSLSSEHLIDSYAPTLNPAIHHSDMRFINKSDVGPTLLSEIEKEQILYREWVISEQTFETIKQGSLFDIPPELLKDENIRDKTRRLEEI